MSLAARARDILEQQRDHSKNDEKKNNNIIILKKMKLQKCLCTLVWIICIFGWYILIHELLAT